MSTKEQLILRTPKLQNFRNPEVILNISDLKPWLESLPLFQPVQTVHDLLDAITAINLQAIPSKKRQPLLDEYRQVILTIYPSLNQDALKRLSIKEEGREQLFSNSTLLCLALSDGYKIMVKDHLENSSTLKQDALLHPLYHAMEAASLALLNSYRSYKTAPQYLYQDIHQLFMLAEHSGLLTQELKDNPLSPCSNNLGGLYTQTMTLSSLDPFRMPSGVAEKLYERLSTLSEYCTVLHKVPSSDNMGVFAIDLAEDKAPQSLFKTSLSNLTTPRVLDTRSMINKLHAEITTLQSEPKGLATNNEIDLLSRLLPASEEQLTRKADRVDTDKTCHISCGIDAICHYLSINKGQLDQALQASDTDNHKHRLEPWTISNESETGLSLCNQQTSLFDVMVGDVIGILIDTDTQPAKKPKVAIIRWIRNDQKNQINIGVEFIGGNLLPADCTVVDANDTPSTFSALFISNVELNNAPSTLLAPKKIYQRGRIIDLYVSQSTLRIKAGFLHDESLKFDRFDFSSHS